MLLVQRQLNGVVVFLWDGEVMLFVPAMYSLHKALT